MKFRVFFIFTIDSVVKKYSRGRKATSNFWKWRFLTYYIWFTRAVLVMPEEASLSKNVPLLSSTVVLVGAVSYLPVPSQIAFPSKKQPEKIPVQTKPPKCVWFLWISGGYDGAKEMRWIWLSPAQEIVPTLPWWMTWPSIAQLYP